jgi:hypothetical protein
VLGGDEPGIFDIAYVLFNLHIVVYHFHYTRPARNNRSNMKPFPITIVCTTMQEVEDIFSCQAAIDQLDFSQDEQSILAAFLVSRVVTAVLRNVDKFYGVLAGMPTAIYLQ